MLDANQYQGFETLTLSDPTKEQERPADAFQDFQTMKWEPWPEAHIEDEQKAFQTNEKICSSRNARYDSEAEAGECWRSAVKCFFRTDMERTGL